MSNNISKLYPRIEDEQVVCAHLEAGNVKYFSILGDFTDNVAVGWLGRKADVFDKVCELPNWNEICGSVVFLNVTELQEIIADNEAEKLAQQIRKSA